MLQLNFDVVTFFNQCRDINLFCSAHLNRCHDIDSMLRHSSLKVVTLFHLSYNLTTLLMSRHCSTDVAALKLVFHFFHLMSRHSLFDVMTLLQLLCDSECDVATFSSQCCDIGFLLLFFCLLIFASFLQIPTKRKSG